MKKLTQAVFILVSLMTATQAAAISTHINSSAHKSNLSALQTHQTISSVYLRISLDENLNGFVDSKLCSFCKPLRITITPKTTAYNNNVKVPLKHAKKRLGQRASIVYDLKTKNVSAIRW